MGMELDKSLRDGLLMLFRYQQPDGILRSFAKGGHERAYLAMPDSLHYILPKVFSTRYSMDDAKQVGSVIKANFYPPENEFGVFGMLLDFAKQALILRDDMPRIRYEQVLRWRHTTHPLGVLPFICAYLADCDRKCGSIQKSFSINPMLPTDNIRLNTILAKGIAENHFHLKGSAPSFMLSWVCLMNDVTQRKKDFEVLNKVKLGESLKDTDQPGRPLRVLVMQAAVIRALLFMLITSKNELERKQATKTLKEYRSFFSIEQPLECEIYVNRIQSIINVSKAISGVKLKDGSQPDYAIDKASKSSDTQAFDALAGEMRLQYCMFHAIFEKDAKISPYIDLFYAYLLISMYFRAEITQNNQLFGFSNFSEYDHRKSIFIENHKPFDKMQQYMSTAVILNDMRYQSLEVRIVPQKSKESISKHIGDYDSAIKTNISHEQALNKMFYVLHIPKVPDNALKTEQAQFIHCRNHELRRNIEHVADAVISLRESRDSMAWRIRGMDACANERDARPEVFAVEFRRLKAHRCTRLSFDGNLPRMLNITYHAGEDFPDVVDGLRAIWEAVEFLELGRADRIGHGLALGIDAFEWYNLKQDRIFVTRQALLDNCAWMLEMLKQHKILDTHLVNILDDECATQYADIYQDTQPFAERIVNFESSTYFKALELRGDDPNVYKDYQDNRAFINSLKSIKNRDFYALRCDDEKSSCYMARRHNVQAIRLYHHYHFNPETKKKGNEVIEYKISQGYVQTVAILQQFMRRWVARKGIGLETNPSSNVLIGNFNRYDKHPLITFNDRGLFDSSENANMFVSVNTDDQGVFDTSLENEYALIARGLEQLKNPDGSCRVSGDRIYQWLNHIREMGLEQSFLNF